jgi:hypothetical protein
MRERRAKTKGESGGGLRHRSREMGRELKTAPGEYDARCCCVLTARAAEAVGVDGGWGERKGVTSFEVVVRSPWVELERVCAWLVPSKGYSTHPRRGTAVQDWLGALTATPRPPPSSQAVPTAD